MGRCLRCAWNLPRRGPSGTQSPAHPRFSASKGNGLATKSGTGWCKVIDGKENKMCLYVCDFEQGQPISESESTSPAAVRRHDPTPQPPQTFISHPPTAGHQPTTIRFQNMGHETMQSKSTRNIPCSLQNPDSHVLTAGKNRRAAKLKLEAIVCTHVQRHAE